MLSSCKTLGISTAAVNASPAHLLRRRGSYRPVFVVALVFLIALPECRAANTPSGSAPSPAIAPAVQGSPDSSPRVSAPLQTKPSVAAPAATLSSTVSAPATSAAVSSPTAHSQQTAGSSVPFPSPAAAPDAAELKAMLRTLAAVPAVALPRQPVAIALEDDTLTAGTWLGRRGRYWASLEAMVTSSYGWGAGWEIVDSSGQIGPHCRTGDSLRFYVTRLFTTEPRSLEMPYSLLQADVEDKLTTWDVNRRQSEIDDHSETYPMTYDGPHLFVNVRVPPGWYVLSFYDFNKDGHDGNNRYRDYVVSIKSRPYRSNIRGIDGFDESAELAHGRIHDFWGGMWTRFLVHGPDVYSVQLNRNYSFCTILAAEMLDTLDELPPPYTGSPEEWLTTQNEVRKRAWQEQTAGTWSHVPLGLSEAATADLALERLERLRLVNAAWWARNSRRYYIPLLRWYRGQAAVSLHPAARIAARLGTCYYRVGLFQEWDGILHEQGIKTAREIEQAIRLGPTSPDVVSLGSDAEYAILRDQVLGKSRVGG